MNYKSVNCWNGFLFHLKSKRSIKIISISTSKEKPKVYYEENYDPGSKEDKWIEIPYIIKNDENLTMIFDHFIIPNHSNSTFCIIYPIIWFLNGDIPHENEHFTLKKGWPMKNQNDVFSNVEYHFIGKIETQIYNEINSNIANMKKAQDLNFLFI